MVRPYLQSFQKRRRGWTLIEAVVASALFMVVGLVVAYLFKMGLTSADRGKMNAEAQQAARAALSSMQKELSQSIRVPAAFPIGSPVVRPSMGVSGSYNDLMFFAAVADLATSTLDPNDYSNYRLIRYYVPAAAPNTLRRAVFQMSVNALGGTPLVHGNGETAPPQAPSPAPLMTSPLPTLSAAAPQNDHWYVQVNTIPTPSPGATTLPKEDDIVALAGPNDLIQFTVTHPAVTNPALDSFGANFDRLTFRIDLHVVRYYQVNLRNPSQSEGCYKLVSDTVRVPDLNI